LLVIAAKKDLERSAAGVRKSFKPEVDSLLTAKK
jgi:hypothetical protein